MSLVAGGGEQTVQVRGCAGVVDHYQPARVGLSPAQRLDRRRWPLGLAGRLQPEPAGQRRQRRHNQGGLLGRHPPDQVVVPGVPVGVLQRELRLPDPAKPVQRLHHRSPTRTQPLMHQRQRRVTAHESWVTRADVPYRRQGPRQRRAYLPPTGQHSRLPAAREQRRLTRPRRTPHRGPQPAHSLSLTHVEHFGA
jgi:hypothetical protein